MLVLYDILLYRDRSLTHADFCKKNTLKVIFLLFCSIRVGVWLHCWRMFLLLFVRTFLIKAFEHLLQCFFLQKARTLRAACMDEDKHVIYKLTNKNLNSHYSNSNNKNRKLREESATFFSSLHHIDL